MFIFLLVDRSSIPVYLTLIIILQPLTFYLIIIMYMKKNNT